MVSAYKIPRPKTAAPPNKLKLPPVDTIMRYPIEVWASSGESFTPPDRVAADQKEMRHYRKLVSDISFELQKEKHKLRQLQGLYQYLELSTPDLQLSDLQLFTYRTTAHGTASWSL